MNIINHMRSNLKKYVILGALMAIFLPASPVLAADSTSGTIDTTSSQAASTGTTTDASTPAPVPTVAPDPAPAPPAVVDPTPVVDPPAADLTAPATTTDTTPPTTTTPSTDTTTTTPPTDPAIVADSTLPPPPCTPVAPLTQGNPNADSTTAAVVNNCLNSGATSGDASVVGSTGGGNATSGNADVQATLINLLQSITNLSGGALATFIQNVYGNQVGDIHIDPATLAAIAAQGNCGCGGNISTSSTGQINNDINLSAITGNASVTDSKRGGNATSGDASVIANLVNIINSLVNSGQSFVGTINIYGDLTGNILLPAGWYDSMLANSNSPPGSSCNCGSGGNSTVDTNQSINNNINANTATGSATVADNRRGGNATSGDALTTLNIINMTNRAIVGGNVLLVFVNVLGHWYGVLMDAPVGQTTGILGGGITSDTISAACGCALNGDISTNSQINNNINLNAQSGNASVTGNRRGGNATSGNATTSLNLFNLINSQLSLANWFGILFINVFGTWNGSLMMEPATVATDPAAGGNGSGATQTPQLFTWTPAGSAHKSHGKGYGAGNGQGDATETTDDQNNDHSLLGAFTTNDGSGPISNVRSSFLSRAWIAIASACVIFMILTLLDRRKNNRKLTSSVPEFFEAI